MVGRHGDEQRLGDQVLDRHGLGRGRGTHEADVEAPVGQGDELGRGVLLGHLELQVGEARPHRAQDARGDRGERRADRPDDQQPDRPVRGLRHQRLRALRLEQHPRRGVEQHPPGRGELGGAARAVEQRHPERALQGTDLLGQRGLTTCSRRAARLKCSSAATARNARSCRSSTSMPRSCPLAGRSDRVTREQHDGWLIRPGFSQQ